MKTPSTGRLGPAKAKALTDAGIRALKPKHTRYEVPDRGDGSERGLCVIVQPSGARSWAVRYRMGGRARKLTIGNYPAVSLATARKQAAIAKGAIAVGRDPGVEKIAKRRAEARGSGELSKASPFGVVAEAYIAKHVERNTRPKTQRQVRWLLGKFTKSWARRPIGEISRVDVHRVLDLMLNSGERVAANRALAVLKALFNWCRERGILDISPIDRMKPPGGNEQERERVLDLVEMMAVWRTCDQLREPYGSAIKLLCLLGARRREISEMEWSELDLDQGIWELPASRSKNKRTHVLPLPALARAILRAMPHLHGARHVFTHDGAGPATNYDYAKQRLDALLPPMRHWTFHDLRRSFATHAAAFTAPHVIEETLGHVTGTISKLARRYNRRSYQPEMLTALETWATRLAGANLSELEGERASGEGAAQIQPGRVAL
jgi:integrase